MVVGVRRRSGARPLPDRMRLKSMSAGKADRPAFIGLSLTRIASTIASKKSQLASRKADGEASVINRGHGDGANRGRGAAERRMPLRQGPFRSDGAAARVGRPMQLLDLFEKGVSALDRFARGLHTLDTVRGARDLHVQHQRRE